MPISLAEKKFYGNQLNRILLLIAIVLVLAAFIYYTLHHTHEMLAPKERTEGPFVVTHANKNARFFIIACIACIIAAAALLYRIIANPSLLAVDADGIRITGRYAFGPGLINWVDIEKFELCSYQDQDLILVFTKNTEYYLMTDSLKRNAQRQLLKDSGAPLAIQVGRINKEDEEVLDYLEKFHAEWKENREAKKR